MRRMLQVGVIALVLVAILFVAIVPTVDLPDGLDVSEIVLMLCFVACLALASLCFLRRNGQIELARVYSRNSLPLSLPAACTAPQRC